MSSRTIEKKKLQELLIHHKDISSISEKMTDIAALEYKHLNDLQKEIHHLGYAGENPVVSPFVQGYKKTTWSSHTNRQLKLSGFSQKEGFCEAEFKAETIFDWLSYVYKVDYRPAIRVKEKMRDRIRIRMCHNSGTNDIMEAKLVYNNEKISSFDRTWTDIDPQYFTEAGYRDHYNKCVGNIKSVEEWSEYIPARSNRVILPFSHCKYHTSGVPLLFFNSTDHATYTFKFINNIAGLLQMQAKRNIIEKDKEGTETITGSVWVDIGVNYNYIEGVSATTTLPTPEIWGRYYCMDPDEKAYTKDIESKRTLITNPDDEEFINETPGGNYEMYTDDIVICDSTGETGYGGTVDIPLTTKDIVKAIFVVAENVTARKNRNLSNYTTNANNLYDGYSPIKRISFAHSGETKIELEGSHLEMIEPFDHFESPPEQHGYHAIALCPRVLNLPTTGIVLEGRQAKLMVTLGNTDPNLIPLATGTIDQGNDDLGDIEEFRDEKKSPQGDDKFIVRVRLMVAKKIVISSIGTDAFKFSIA